MRNTGSRTMIMPDLPVEEVDTCPGISRNVTPSPSLPEFPLPKPDLVRDWHGEAEKDGALSLADCSACGAAEKKRKLAIRKHDLHEESDNDCEWQWMAEDSARGTTEKKPKRAKGRS